MGKFLWEGREKGVAMFPYKEKNNKIACSFGELNPDLPGERQVSLPLHQTAIDKYLMKLIITLSNILEIVTWGLKNKSWSQF